MNNKLSKLFDYQKFAGNERLSDLIRETEERISSFELSDDDLSMVSAAGSENPDPSLNSIRGIGK